mmetsp:Transcript_40885/g.62890  ORF Transcript_40885/g.62890 Transcript_40885/m.62890 type:complete len:702 (+) Transcript_40885:289-2394(+)
MRVSRPHPLTSGPSLESRNAMESRNYNRDGVQYQSTPDGDVVVVEPSFDAEDNDGRGSQERPSSSQGNAGAAPRHGRSKRSHTRNLSEHFFEATTLSGGQVPEMSARESEDRYEPPRGYRGPPPTISPAIGKKHRRVFSGDVTNPREAHRRINSVGKSAHIQRRSYGQERQHQRVDSLGLDVLTAAADVSREELAAAAGATTTASESESGRDARSPWEPPASRRSPVEMIAYNHNAAGVPPPPAPPRAPYAPPGPPPPGYYGSGMPYSQAPYHSSYYHPGHGHGYPPGPPHPPPSGYPVQYSRGQGPFMRHGGPPPPKPEPETSGPVLDSYNHKKASEEGSATREGSAMTPPPPVPPSHWRGGTAQGSQTYVTTIGVGEGSRTLHATHFQHGEGAPPSYADGHHRKTSSVTSWIPPIYSANPNDTPEHPLKGGHHRVTSSSVSFLQCFDVGLDNQDAAFLQNLQASAESPSKPYGAPSGGTQGQAHEAADNDADDAQDGGSKLAPGGTSKRVRRKCTVPNCENRVVQGGLCISHGAKRKTCRHPGCSKNVKKAGLCSTHGPARKRCDADGCTKVAVQGGKCIAHGAKKKLCCIDNCTKQAILAGMCKKHHDSSRSSTGTSSTLAEPKGSDTASENSAGSPVTKKATHKPKHTRGLSIFQEISADTVGTLLSSETEEGSEQPPPRTNHRHQSTFSRDFGSLY